MKKVYAITHDTYASGLTASTSDLDNLASLAVGAFAVINKQVGHADYDQVADIAIAVANIANVASLTAFQIAVMTSNGLQLSPILYSKSTKGLKVADVTGVAKVVVVGNQTDGGTTYKLNLPTIVANQVAGFIVTDTSKPPYDTSRNRYYTYTTKAGDTSAIIVAALVAAVNADSKAIVTAALAYAAATDGIRLTGDVAGKPFEVSPVGIFQLADIEITTALVFAQGAYADVLEMEADHRVELGDTNVQEGDAAFSFTSNLVAGDEYILGILDTTMPNLREPDMDGHNWKGQVILAFQDNLTNTDAAGYSLTALNRLLDKVIA
jgi:hypothetical protein